MKYLVSFILLQLLIFNNSVVQAQWIHTNGPFGGEAGALAVSGNNIFACVDGTVFLSNNIGTIWNATNLVNEGVNALAANDEKLFAGTGGGGVLFSTDNGINWIPGNSGLPSPPLNVFTLMASGKNLFVYIVSNIVGQPRLGVYRSTDNGSSWVSSNNGLGTANVNVFATGQNGTGDMDVFAGTSSGVMLSINNGESWSPIGLENIDITALAVISNGTDGTNIFAGTSRGMFLSTDTGLHWNPLNSGLADTLISALAVSTNGSAGTNIFAGTTGGNIFISNNNGTNWKPGNDGIPFVSVHALAAGSNGRGNTSIFAGTFPSGVFLSTNSGSTWTALNNGINSINISALTISGRNIFAGGSTGAFLSTNNGASWSYIGLMNTGEVVALLAATTGTNDTVILAGTWNGLYHSTDNGGSWVNTGLTYDVTALAVSPKDMGGINIFAGTRGGGIFLSTDKGASWKSENTGLPLFSNISALSFSGANLFAATDYALYLSSDNGMSWGPTGLRTPANTFIYCLAISPNPTGDADIFVGTNDEGVLVSNNNGVTWHSANTGLTDTCVYSIVISGSYLFAGTNLNGVWKRQLSELTSVQETTPTQIPKHFSLSQNYPNPFNPITIINYQIPKPGLVTLKVYDILGREVTTLVNENKIAGTYDFTFNASRFTSGVYIYQLRVNDFVSSKKMILLK